MRKNLYKQKFYRKSPIKKTILRQGDTAIVISGKHKNQVGKIIKIFKGYNKVAIENVNIRKVRLFDTTKRTEKNKYKSTIVTKHCPIHLSNVSYYDEELKKPVKLGIQIKDDKKVRYIKKTGRVI